MRSFLRTIDLTLKKRLADHVKFSVRIEAEGFSSEAGVLQSVGRRFMKVNGQYFVPESVNAIILIGAPPTVRKSPILVRSSFEGVFAARLVRVGLDYVELLTDSEDDPVWSLIPLNKIISLEKA